MLKGCRWRESSSLEDLHVADSLLMYPGIFRSVRAHVEMISLRLAAVTTNADDTVEKGRYHTCMEEPESCE